MTDADYLKARARAIVDELQKAQALIHQARGIVNGQAGDMILLSSGSNAGSIRSAARHHGQIDGEIHNVVERILVVQDRLLEYANGI